MEETLTENTLIETIANLAPVVAQANDALRAATEKETAAETAVLERVVELVRPALRALSSRPLLGECESGVGDVNRAKTTSTRATWAGLYVGEGVAGPVRDRPHHDGGQYEGEDLFLCHGTWVELSYSGSWSKWQGSTCEWTTTERELTTAEVAAEYDLLTILENLAKALEGQAAGKAGERTKASIERTAKLEAVAALLGSK